MDKRIKVAVLGSTGYVGLELVKILNFHPNVIINFLGCENNPNTNIQDFEKNLKNSNLPLLSLNSDFDPLISDVVFLALPHGISNN